MAITKVPSDMIQVANNVTDTTIGGANSGVSVTFDSLGVISAASNVALSINTADISDSAVTDAKISAVANSKITGVMTTAQVADSAITTNKLADANVTVGKLATTVPLGTKNLIINGDMRIDQRNAGASVTPTGGEYILDRWQSSLSQSSKYTAQQNAGSITPPDDFINYLGATSTSSYSVGTSDYFYLLQKIEGLNASHLKWGTASAKTVTLSFKVRSSLTGTFVAAIRSGADDAAYPATYTINSANTWETKSITIAGPTSGTFATTNAACFSIWFSLGAGSAFESTANTWGSGSALSVSGATSVVGTSGATFYITGVQLEVGVTATPFEHRPYDMELARCQRYCLNSAGNAVYDMLNIGFNVSTTEAIMNLFLPVKMRAMPTLSYSNVVASDGVSTFIVSSITVYGSNGNTQQIRMQVASTGFTQFRPCYLVSNNTTSSSFILSAEL